MDPTRATGMLLALLALAACAPATRPSAPASASTEGLTGANAHLDPAASELRVLVFRGGPLAAAGHNHVLVLRGVEGRLRIPDDPHALEGRLSFAVGDFSVDEPSARAEAGADFGGEIRAEDIAGTRRNLLGPKVLDAAAWPTVTVLVGGVRGGPDRYTVGARVTLRGVQSDIEIPVQVRRDGTALVVDGEFTLRQTALGLEPFSIFLGALQVEDALRARVHLRILRDETARAG